MRTLYIPGIGETNLEINKAVREYDDRLTFAQNERSKQWCVFIKVEGDEPDVPVLGYDHVPSRDQVIKDLYCADTWRHGPEALLREIDKKNEAWRKAKKDAYAEVAGEVAEAIEYGLHKEGKTPYLVSTRKNHGR
jgi:hypothetical protein